MAALASPRQPSASVQQLTPPTSAHGGRGSWDFAVPLDHSKNSYEQQPYMSEDANYSQPYSARQPASSQSNGVGKPYRTNTLDSQGRYNEDPYKYSGANGTKEVKKHPSADVNSEEADGISEYYKAVEEGKKKPNPKSRLKKKSSKAAEWTEAEKDESNWIHRDKLKEIETRELEEAGFRLGRASRSNSRSQSQTRKTRDRTNSELTEGQYSVEERHDDRRMVSPIPAEDEEEIVEQQAAWDFRSQEEIAADRDQWSPRNNQARPGTSRIPVARIGAVPVPGKVVDRDAPLPRSRTGSANWSGDAIAQNGARARSASISSQAMLDDADDNRRMTPPENFSTPNSPISGSPTKAKTPGKAAPMSGARKTSVQRAQSKPRRVSPTSPIKRPGTSGGSISRPTTSHRPEGEAPWIATMYKPDPRLPPDQQIIPTHAKRMQQEQWENEGKTGSIYDKDFRLLNTEQFKDKRASQISPIDVDAARENEEWPLPSPTKPTVERIDTGVKSPTNEQGAYKLTPTIPQSPRIPSPGPRNTSTPQPKPETTRVPEPVEDAKEKKGCCCIVM